MSKISRHPSGLRIVSRHMPDTQSVTVSFFIGSGGRYEDLKNEYGVAHFIEHLLFKGSRRRPSPKQIAEQIDGVGGVINAYTAEDHTCFYVKLPSQHFDLAMDILTDTLTEPLFDAVELERERNIILEEMRVYEDDPARFVFDMVGPLLWPQESLRSNIIGTEQSISSMKRAVVMDYFNDLYRLNNMVLSVAGNITHDEVLKSVNKYITTTMQESIKRGFLTVSTDIAKQKFSILQRPTNQAHLVVAGRGPALDQDDDMPMRLLSTVLGDGMSSRLFMNVRENRGLAYTIFMSTSQFIDTGKFEIYAGVTHDKLEEALGAIGDELAKISSTLIDDSELNKAKQQLRGRLIMGLESNSAVADRLGTQLILQDKIIDLEQTLNQIDSVSSQDVLKVAKKYLEPVLLRLAIIGEFDQSQGENFVNIISGRI